MEWAGFLGGLGDGFVRFGFSLFGLWAYIITRVHLVVVN